MTRITVDATLRTKLHNFSEPLELCDEAGRILAHITPAVEPLRYEPWEPPISEEELRRREQSNNWHTTEQVLAHLKSLSGQ